MERMTNRMPTSFAHLKTKFLAVFPYIILILGTIGILDASYLTYEKFSGAIPICGEGFDCGAVLNSQWASIGPVPLSIFGLGYYITIAVLASMLILEIKLPNWLSNLLAKIKIDTTNQLITVISSFGFAFSLYLVSLMAFVIEAWCLYCLFSAITSTLIWITTLARNYASHN